MSVLALTPELILKAYAAGVFPMAESGNAQDIYWVEPKTRGVLPLDKFHVPARLARTVRQGLYRITINQAFGEVIERCAKTPRKQQETWINPTIKSLYGQLYEIGHAHSIEAWKNDELVGGLYGVSLGTAFFGESMFSTARDASKVALVHLVARLTKQGYTLLDAQFITDHLAQFGAIEIAREEYHGLLRLALSGVAFFGETSTDSASELALVQDFLKSKNV
jgi:leucyl/phenylalanyl-tRNA--protein transferase